MAATWPLSSDVREAGLDLCGHRATPASRADRVQRFTVLHGDDPEFLVGLSLPTLHLEQNTSPFVVDEE